MAQDNVLSHLEFTMFQQLIYKEIGISLADHKRALVQSRLKKWLSEFELSNYKELYKKIYHDKSGQMLMLLINAITTNVTSFFREETQWIYLQIHIKEFSTNKKNNKIRIWSAACSSGQEPYSIIMFLMEYLPNFDQWDIKILATDISENILQKAKKGIYLDKDIESMPRNILFKYFNKVKDKKNKKSYMVKDRLKSFIVFRSFNLVTGNFNMFKNKFDFIFCRNVMIYFDKQTQNILHNNYAKLMDENSRIFLGHSESIQKNNNKFKLETPSIYKLA